MLDLNLIADQIFFIDGAPELEQELPLWRGSCSSQKMAAPTPQHCEPRTWNGEWLTGAGFLRAASWFCRMKVEIHFSRSNATPYRLKIKIMFCSLLLFVHGVGSQKKNSNVAKKGPDQQRILNSHTIKSLSTPHLRHVTDFTLGMFRQFSIY